MFSFSDANYQRASFSGGNDCAGCFIIEQQDDIGPNNAFQGDAYGFFQ
jgi:hypothetical protein